MKQENKLLQYSSLAVSFIFLNEENAQVVYTDIEPDIEIQFEGQTAFVDMDNDGSLDFGFLKTSNTYTTTIASHIRYLRKFWAGPYIESNEIAGIMVTHGGAYGTDYYAFALVFNDYINNDLIFQNWGFQDLGSGLYDSAGVWHYRLGYWSPDIDSAFLGIHFKGEDECMHYGWIRCTMADSINRFIIHDYAYESKCETGILAGDTIGDTTTIAINEKNSLSANVYSFDKSIFINLNEFMSGVEIHIYDLNGKMIYSGEIVNQSTQIELNEAKGVYFVELINGEKKFRKKVYLN